MLHLLKRFSRNERPISSYYIFVFSIISILVFAVLHYGLNLYYTKVRGEPPIYNQDVGIIDCLYYSIVTQTTLGYGDIVPTHMASRLLVVAQCISILFALYLI